MKKWSSFWSGAASIFDLSGASRNIKIKSHDRQSDAELIAQDWQLVGDDIRKAIDSFVVEENEIKWLMSPSLGGRLLF